jgi:hypothetical protein
MALYSSVGYSLLNKVTYYPFIRFRKAFTIKVKKRINLIHMPERPKQGSAVTQKSNLSTIAIN